MAAVLALLLGSALVVLPASPASADAVRSGLWYLAALDVPAAHAITRGEGVTVALLDTGVNAQHPDLVGSVLAGDDSYTSGGNGQSDTEGHGTAMAATIAGHGHGPGNADGVLGIAPGARILPLKLSTGGSYKPAVVARAIDTAIERGAKVISASISVESDDVLRSAVRRALDKDIVFVGAFGNANSELAGGGDPAAPGRYEGVVGVCATDRAGNRAEFSTRAAGPAQLTICAPGVDGTAAKPDGTYATGKRGTSMSAAIVAGAAALIRSKNPSMPNYEVVNRLVKTAVDKGPPGRDADYGYGNLNLPGALTAQVAPTTSPTPWVKRSASPTPTPTPKTSASAGADAGPATGGAGVAVAVVVGVVLVLVLAGGGVWLVRRRRTGP